MKKIFKVKNSNFPNSLVSLLSNNKHYFNNFFQKVNRVSREEDNLFIILTTLLQKDIYFLIDLLKSNKDFNQIKLKLKQRLQDSYSNKIVASIAY
jgi:hypothetical protein